MELLAGSLPILAQVTGNVGSGLAAIGYGADSHGPGAHDHKAGAAYLQKAIQFI